MSDDHKHDDKDCAHCAAIEAGMSPKEAHEQFLIQVTENIKKSGITVVGVPEDVQEGIPNFFYTIGFTELNMPEIVMFGLPVQYAMGCINGYFSEIVSGKREKKAAPFVIDDMFNLPIHVIDADETAAREYGCQAFYFYEDKGILPKFVQWVFTDRNGVAPWSPAFEPHFSQPVLLVPNEDNSLPNPYLTTAQAVKPTLH